MPNKYEQEMQFLQLKSSMIASVVGFYALSNAALAMNQNLTDTQFADQLNINKKYQDNLIQEIINYETQTTTRTTKPTSQRKTRGFGDGGFYLQRDQGKNYISKRMENCN